VAVKTVAVLAAGTMIVKALLEQHVADGRLGRKVGKGVYDY
jgi:hypothetical protein